MRPAENASPAPEPPTTLIWGPRRAARARRRGTSLPLPSSRRRSRLLPRAISSPGVPVGPHRPAHGLRSWLGTKRSRAGGRRRASRARCPRRQRGRRRRGSSARRRLAPRRRDRRAPGRPTRGDEEAADIERVGILDKNGGVGCAPARGQQEVVGHPELPGGRKGRQRRHEQVCDDDPHAEDERTFRAQPERLQPRRRRSLPVHVDPTCAARAQPSEGRPRQPPRRSPGSRPPRRGS
jgi:hypothetical protein